MDQVDINLIRLLQSDGRMSISEMSKKLALSRPSVAERLKRLQERGIIEGFFAQVSPSAVGRKLLVMIELSEIRVSLTEFEQMIAHEPDVLECHKATGHVHYYIKAAFNGMDELTQLIERLIPYGNTRTSIILDSPVARRVILPSEELRKE
ncbi:AsnC family transcriptional regulator [Siminovitchia terrae]|uniref:AsnC family transcriptional regulator n=1 Tax=Siminovitchia terrae TaxID=1914933 RepID=A0A429X4A1_SIMTE|nr:Lrp/AsnC family transcriptional regulator [Siminovitchia terrae]RST58194.1 Lrp/AsnC family transcriptional regulator [Siminovitchia terrae]GIN98745.1 AsnC family transcriptional regulator [Siminovitchia terrae]